MPNIFPGTFALYQNYPNPFNPQTTITFDVGGEPGTVCEVNLAIYDVRGRLVRPLVDGKLEAGRHSVVWDGRNTSGRPVASGLYFSTLQTGDKTYTRKMAIVK